MAHIVAEATESAPAKGTFYSLRYRDFRYLWQGQLGASATQWMEQVARPLLILELTDSALMVGLLQATRMVPQLLIGVWAGVLADRLDKRRLLLTSRVVTLLGHLATAIVIFAGVIEPWMVFVTTFVTGSAMAFDQPTRQAIIPRIVPREVLANAVALNSAANNVMRILGGAIAGLLLIFFDFGDLYLIQSLMCLWVLFCIYQIRVEVKSDSKKQQGSMWSELMEGFSLARNDKAILYVLLLSLCLFVFAMPYQGLFVPLIAVENLNIGRSGVGMLIAVTGVGALFGSLVLATVGDSLTKRGLVMFGLVGVYMIGLLLFANAGSLLLAVPALLITGATQTSFMSLNHTFVLGRAPPELHGRVISLFSLDRGLLPLGAILGGVLAEALGAQVALTIMASICLVCAAVIFAFVPVIRKIA